MYVFFLVLTIYFCLLLLALAFADSYSFVVCMFPLECVNREIYFDLSAFFVYFHGTCHLNISINSRYTHAISIVSSNVNLFKLIVTFIKFSLFFFYRSQAKKNYSFPCLFQYFFSVNGIVANRIGKSSVNVISVTSRL